MAITNLIDTVLDARDMGTQKIKRYDEALGDVGKTGSKLPRILGAVTAAVGIATVAIGAGVIQVLNYSRGLQELGNQARVLDLPVEEFDRYRIAARLAGIEQDQLFDGLKTFRERVEEEFAGERTIFAELGVDITSATGGLRDFNSILEDTLTGLQSRPDLRVLRAGEIFGDEAVRLANIGSGADLRATIGGLEQRGLGRTDTSAADELLQAQTLLAESNEALKTSINDVLAPVVTTWIERLDKVSSALVRNREAFQIGVATVLESLPIAGGLFRGARGRAIAAAEAGREAEDFSSVGGITTGPRQGEFDDILAAVVTRVDRSRPELLGQQFAGETLGRAERQAFAEILDDLDAFIRGFQLQQAQRRQFMPGGGTRIDLRDRAATIGRGELAEVSAEFEKQFEGLEGADNAAQSIATLTGAIAGLTNVSDSATEVVVRMITQIAAAVARSNDPSGDILGIGLGALGSVFGGPIGGAAGSAVGSSLRTAAHRGESVAGEMARAARANPGR